MSYKSGVMTVNALFFFDFPPFYLRNIFPFSIFCLVVNSLVFLLPENQSFPQVCCINS